MIAIELPKLPLASSAYPLGDVVADGTSFLAGWHFAVKASLGLTHGLGKRIVFGDFLKLVHFTDYFISR